MCSEFVDKNHTLNPLPFWLKGAAVYRKCAVTLAAQHCDYQLGAPPPEIILKGAWRLLPDHGPLLQSTCSQQ